MLVFFSKKRFVLLSASLLLASATLKVGAQAISPVVKTDKGYIRGVSENGISVFKGIPYAEAPVGELRFRAAVEHARWNDTLPTVKFGSVAAQFTNGKVQGSEDCLTLNVYAPKLDKGKRAVLVWVHGGAMITGSGKWQDGHAFSDRDDIVTVTINYRLGVFGFLYLGDMDKRYASSGNNGLLDCIMALNWIKQNIAAFGGDPARVTIMGESAGAKMVSSLLVSPKAKGLFEQYIAESGAVQSIRDSATAKNVRTAVLRQLHLQPKWGLKLLDLPADSIIKAQAALTGDGGYNAFFGPTDDGIAIVGDPYRYAEGKNIPPVRALLGFNKSEAAAFIKLDNWFARSDTAQLKYIFGDAYPSVYQDFLRELKSKTVYNALVTTLTRYMYELHTYRWVDALAQGGTPVWMYRFDYDKGPLGAAHGVEMQYIWSNNQQSFQDEGKKQLALDLHGRWVAFIKTGNPNISGLPQWPMFGNQSRQILIFDTPSHLFSLKQVYQGKEFPASVYVLK